MGDDIHALEVWASIFLSPGELAAQVAKNYKKNKNLIKADIAIDKAQWEAHQWWAAGITTADLATLAIGPVETHYPF